MEAGRENRKNQQEKHKSKKKKLNTNKETWFVPRSRNCESREVEGEKDKNKYTKRQESTLTNPN
jgi:hypothetical protein